jgi:hypothetical protein
MTLFVTRLAYPDVVRTVMKHIDGTAARQLDLLDDPGGVPGRVQARPRPTLQVLRKDIYAELARRRRRAQIAARHELERAE